jgi:ABC-type uncharacterized transport system permease subunit
MTALAATLPAYLKLASLRVRTTYAYRGEVVGGLLVVLLRILLLSAVWTAAYAGRGSVDGVALPDVIAFVTLGNLQLVLMRPMLVWYVQHRIHEGQIGLDLARPVPFLGQLFAQQVGATAGLLPFVVLSVPLALLVGKLAPPASLGAGLAYLVSLVLAYLIATLIGLLMGLVAFWTVQSLGVQVSTSSRRSSSVGRWSRCSSSRPCCGPSPTCSPSRPRSSSRCPSTLGRSRIQRPSRGRLVCRCSGSRRCP